MALSFELPSCIKWYTGTPAQIARAPEDVNIVLDDNRSRRKSSSTPGDQSMRRTIQDLVSSVDPNVKIEPEVEDVSLSLIPEFVCVEV